MDTIVDHTSQAIGTRIRIERAARDWSAAELAERAGISKATVSKIERLAASPTAAVLGKISGAFGLPLSTLIARAEGQEPRLLRAAEQTTWTDPRSRYVRRSLSPAAGHPLELIAVDLPAHARVSFPASAYAFLHQQVWVMSGALAIREGETEHLLKAGDCLQFGPPAKTTFENRERVACTYLVAIVKR